MAKEQKALLSDDTEDDDIQIEDIISKIQVRTLKCPVCGLESCFHNLPYTMQ